MIRKEKSQKNTYNKVKLTFTTGEKMNNNQRIVCPVLTTAKSTSCHNNYSLLVKLHSKYYTNNEII